MNTRISYLYRDASNYKKYNVQVLEGTLTREEIKRMLSLLEGGEWFIPSQVGLPEERFRNMDFDEDHAFFELSEEDFEETEAPPTITLTAKELYGNFVSTGGIWDDVKPFMELMMEMEDEEEDVPEL